MHSYCMVKGIVMVKPRQFTPDEDAALLAAAQQGDSASFEALLRKYLKRIYNLAYLLSGETGIATETTSRTFAAAYSEIRSLRSTVRFSSWLVTLMLREYGGLLEFGEVLPEAAATGGIPVETASESPLMQSLRRSVRSLTPKQGVVLILHYARGYRLERIGEILQVREDVILSRLYTAWSELARLLKQGGGAQGRESEEDAAPHGDVRRGFAPYLDNSATEPEKDQIRRHLAECGSCREALAALEWIAEHLKTLPDLEPPAGLGQAIMEAVLIEVLPVVPVPSVYARFSRGKKAGFVIMAVAVSLYWYLVLRENGSMREPPVPLVEEPATTGGTVRSRPGTEKGEAVRLPLQPLPFGDREERTPEQQAGSSRPDQAPLPPPPPLSVEPVAPPRQRPVVAKPLPQPVRQARPRAEMPASLPPEWGEGLPDLRTTPRNAVQPGGRGDETAVLLLADRDEVQPEEIERAVTALGGRVTGRAYSGGRDILYTSIAAESVMDLMSSLRRIGTIKELPHIPEGAAGAIDLVIRW